MLLKSDENFRSIWNLSIGWQELRPRLRTYYRSNRCFRSREKIISSTGPASVPGIDTKELRLPLRTYYRRNRRSRTWAKIFWAPVEHRIWALIRNNYVPDYERTIEVTGAFEVGKKVFQAPIDHRFWALIRTKPTWRYPSPLKKVSKYSLRRLIWSLWGEDFSSD